MKLNSQLDSGFNLTSMTDIVFLLLIFFVLASTLIVNSAIEVELPKSKHSTVPPSAAMVVTITADGDYYVGQKKIAFEALRDELLIAQAKHPNPNLSLKLDKDVPVQSLVDVQALAHELDLKVTLLVKK
jgi:biopolymer transport protein ExbD